MESVAILEAAVAQGASGQQVEGRVALDRSQDSQVADFERLLAQAHEDQAQVQLVNRPESLAKVGVDHMIGPLQGMSDQYMHSSSEVQASLRNFDINDSHAVGKVLANMSDLAVRGALFHVAVNEITSVKGSVQQLFQNQG
jgi:hypothetical protein